jgi:hypothetical protein
MAERDGPSRASKRGNRPAFIETVVCDDLYIRNSDNIVSLFGNNIVVRRERNKSATRGISPTHLNIAAEFHEQAWRQRPGAILAPARDKARFRCRFVQDRRGDGIIAWEYFCGAARHD